MGGKIVIVGCGYIGAALGSRIAGEAGTHQKFGSIIGTTTNPEREAPLRNVGITPIVVSLAEVQRLAGILKDATVAVITVAPRGAQDSYREVYLKGMRHFLKAAEGSGLKRIIYTSSTSVYGQEDGSWVDEDSPAEPRNEKGRIILDTELALMEGSVKLELETTIVRFTGIYGPDRGPATFLKNLAGKERTDGDSYLNLIHRDDIVEALSRLIAKGYGGILNLSDDHPIPRREYYDRVMAEAGLEAIRWVTPEKRVLGKRVRNRRIKDFLGFELKYPAH